MKKLEKLIKSILDKLVPDYITPEENERFWRVFFQGEKMREQLKNYDKLIEQYIEQINLLKEIEREALEKGDYEKAREVERLLRYMKQRIYEVQKAKVSVEKGELIFLGKKEIK